MGWNELSIRRDPPLVEGVDGEYAYFVHSYYAEPDDDAAVRTTTDAGGPSASTVLGVAGNVFGTQFPARRRAGNRPELRPGLHGRLADRSSGRRGWRCPPD